MLPSIGSSPQAKTTSMQSPRILDLDRWATEGISTRRAVDISAVDSAISESAGGPGAY